MQRRFHAERPNQLWVADITDALIWTQVPFVTDVFSRAIVGWSLSLTLKMEALPLQALDMAVRGVSDDLTGSVHHPDRG